MKPVPLCIEFGHARLAPLLESTYCPGAHPRGLDTGHAAAFERSHLRGGVLAAMVLGLGV
eukprot:6000844-Pyramimonas_sp.AAC.1